MRTMTHADLEAWAIKEEREFTSRFGPATLSRPARIMLAALAHRLNGHPLLVSVPDEVEPGGPPEARFAAWLDAGAPGLVEAACECMVEDLLDLGGHAVDEADLRWFSFQPDTPPVGSSFRIEDVTRRLRSLLAGPFSPYDVVIADPERVLADFIAAEMGDVRADGWAAFSIDPTSLAHRTRYFDGFRGDACLGWTDGATLKVLLTNGSD